jgi:hypothetical protein
MIIIAALFHFFDIFFDIFAFAFHFLSLSFFIIFAIFAASIFSLPQAFLSAFR